MHYLPLKQYTTHWYANMSHSDKKSVYSLEYSGNVGGPLVKEINLIRTKWDCLLSDRGKLVHIKWQVMVTFEIHVYIFVWCAVLHLRWCWFIENKKLFWRYNVIKLSFIFKKILGIFFVFYCLRIIRSELFLQCKTISSILLLVVTGLQCQMCGYW